jgi:hypothetical protein
MEPIQKAPRLNRNAPGRQSRGRVEPVEPNANATHSVPPGFAGDPALVR